MNKVMLAFIVVLIATNFLIYNRGEKLKKKYGKSHDSVYIPFVIFFLYSIIAPPTTKDLLKFFLLMLFRKQIGYF